MMLRETERIHGCGNVVFSFGFFQIRFELFTELFETIITEILAAAICQEYDIDFGVVFDFLDRF